MKHSEILYDIFMNANNTLLVYCTHSSHALHCIYTLTLSLTKVRSR